MTSCCRLAFGAAVLIYLSLLVLVAAELEQGECRADDASCRVVLPSVRASDDEQECEDLADTCGGMVGPERQDSCIVGFEFARKNCRKTCQLCGANTEASASNVYSLEPQVITGPTAEATWERLAQVNVYMYDQIFVNVTYAKVRTDCKNRHEQCTFWAASGECQANPEYMQKQCAPACFSCDQLDVDLKCPFDAAAPVAWSQAGDLQAIFERIITDPQFAQYDRQILSHPDPPAGSSSQQGPWVIVLDNFLSADECRTLQDLGNATGYKRSRDVGARQFDGSYDGKESAGRTSTNAWCTEDCWEHAITQTVHDRMAHLIQIPKGNYEHFQLLKYEVGQFYETHHDYIPHHVERFPGPRILTIFLYLNDVEQGGGTNFPRLNLTVYPKQGRALLWPSVLDSNPRARDALTHHQALPLEKGVKYGANVWVHQRDYKDAWAKGCA